jgi:hypothetical protein
LVYTGSAFGLFTGGTEADALCTTFDKLNRTGVKLSIFEVLTTRPLKINLRELWEKAREEYSILDNFEVDPYYVLHSHPNPSPYSAGTDRSAG